MSENELSINMTRNSINDANNSNCVSAENEIKNNYAINNVERYATNNNQQNIEEKKKPKKKLFDGLFIRLKKIKHLDIILTVLFIAIILLIYFSSFTGTSLSKENTKSNTQTASDLEEYSKKLEEKLEKTLTAIKDAGKVSVLIYFNEGIETVIAYTTEVETLPNNGVVKETKSPVLVTNSGKTQPIILQENMPTPSSIVIVSTGAKDTNVKLEILRAVQTMFNINSSKIEIFAGN